ncbi:YheV family putative metal-binding protein [Dongshaea marina]|uniref:YheV family putative metal-binding protein n=1 Tax=Dongshaea marina TaxID=2047966 RepID=UPI000D3E4F78|nr:YheV family putative metal-binding protein [Dongshaea marina]
MQRESRWRFIAGASCPKCEKLDGMQYRDGEQGQEMRCAFCDYQQLMDEPSSQEAPAQMIGVFKP